MPEAEVIAWGWADRLSELSASASRAVHICSPFVTRSGTAQVLDVTADGIDLKLLASFNAACFRSGYSETGAFRDIIQRGGEVRNCQRLHAKVYLFDDDAAVVTSANLTGGGLRANRECGVLVQERQLVGEVAAYFSDLWRDEDTGAIRSDTLDAIDDILRRVPPPSEAEQQAVREAEESLSELVLEQAEARLNESLTGWRGAVFKVLTRIDARSFELSDVYDYVPELARQYPDNENVKAKIRQQLQELRDLGLIKFLGGGYYRKLWS